MAIFNKSNWLRTCSSEHARVYVPNAIAAGNVTGNGGATTITLTVPWQFQGNGQCECSFPATLANANINSGLSFGTVQLLAPSSGSYSSGQHPRVQFPLINSTNGNLNMQQTSDIICVQY
jgi:hypothetical protein